jgi:hypothetical protein
MRQSSESSSDWEHSVPCSGRIVLECKKCRELLILLGLEDDWRSERSAFECECGERLTLADRNDGEALAIGELLRRLKVQPGTD